MKPVKIAVEHHSLNIPGGAERLCLITIEALRNRGHNVTLVSVERTDWNLVKKNFGSVTTPNHEAYVTKARLSRNLTRMPIASLYFLTYIAQLLAGKSGGKYDLTLNTFGDIINSIADLTYVHFPLRAAVSYSQIPAFSNRSMWQTVSPIYDAVTGTMDKICPGNLLTNSKFMQKIIQDVLRRKSIVVYPPVGVETFSSRCYRPRKNGCMVAVVASYTPKRHLDQVPVIAKNSRFAKFVVMGKADEYSLPTLKRLKYLVKDLHVENKIRFLTNVPFSELAHMLSDAKLYLHVMHNDHFGISVVEAMASGCVPIVHRSGGPWLDILDSQQGAYGYSYSNAEEAASIIDTLITDEDLRSKIASRASYRAKRFDRSVFMNKMVEVVEQIAS